MLLYPTFYEGLECSSNVIYTSLVANQHLTDTTEWMVKNAGKKIYMVGSDYVGPQTYNAIVKKLAEQQGATVIANRFFPLTQTEFGSALSDIRSAKPDLIWNTIVGAGIPAFLKQYQRGRLHAADDADLLGHLHRAGAGGGRRLGGEGPLLPGLLLRDDENAGQQVVHQALPGEIRQPQPTNMPMQASYTSAYLLAAAIEKAGDATPAAILQAFPGVSRTPPGEGTVTVKDNHHTTHTGLAGARERQSALRRRRQSSRRATRTRSRRASWRRRRSRAARGARPRRTGETAADARPDRRAGAQRGRGARAERPRPHDRLRRDGRREPRARRVRDARRLRDGAAEPVGRFVGRDRADAAAGRCDRPARRPHADPLPLPRPGQVDARHVRAGDRDPPARADRRGAAAPLRRAAADGRRVARLRPAVPAVARRADRRCGDRRRRDRRCGSPARRPD